MVRGALILFAITALACRDKDAPKPAPAPSQAPVPVPVTPTPSRPNAAPERPALPTQGLGLGSGTIADQFAADPIDQVWKSRTEGELRRQFAKMKHAPTGTECHASLCRLTIVGSETDVEASVDELQVLRQQAQSLLLTAPTKGADGRMTLVAYLQYERTDSR
jgi:hypothetical protein